MKTSCLIVSVASFALLPAAWADAPAVTVYNQDFGVVRERITLDLQAGVNQVRSADITAHLEPDSVILRDPTGKHRLQILEQNYRADPVSQELLLSLFEGKTIDFLVPSPQDPAKTITVRGKIVRSAYVPHRQAWQRYGQEYAMAQQAYVGYSSGGQPIIEVDGQLRFGLPGTPLFPNLGDDTILKPTLHWQIETDAPGKFEAELSYVTGGMSWQADYNATAPETGDTLDLTGWVTMDNQTGKDFRDAKLKLMAGDVSKLQPGTAGRDQLMHSVYALSEREMAPPVSEKAFDEFHLYTVEKPTTLRDRETKQIEFVRATGVTAPRIYVYDGAKIDWQRWRGYDPYSLRTQQEYGTQCNPKVWVMRELRNNAANHLGMPLPAGRVRFYRQDADERLEFVGENLIGHTPKNELIRIYTGNAFDIVGERRRTAYNLSSKNDWLDETFEIKVRNHKKEPVEVRIVEHLYRWDNWEIREKSDDYLKMDSHTIEFRVAIPPDGEKVVTYQVHYSW